MPFAFFKLQIQFLFLLVLFATTKRIDKPLPTRYILCEHWSQYHTNSCQETQDQPLEILSTAKLAAPRDVTSMNLANLFSQMGWRCWCQSWTILMSTTVPFLPTERSNWLTCVRFSGKRSYSYSLLVYILEKESDHILIRKRVEMVKLQCGSFWLHKDKTASESHLLIWMHL